MQFGPIVFHFICRFNVIFAHMINVYCLHIIWRVHTITERIIRHNIDGFGKIWKPIYYILRFNVLFSPFIISEITSLFWIKFQNALLLYFVHFVEEVFISFVYLYFYFISQGYKFFTVKRCFTPSHFFVQSFEHF